MDFWNALLAIHLLAMAFFVGGQLVLVAVLVPLLRGTDQMKQVARRFAHTSGAALVVSILTGIYLASHYHQWGDWNLRAKIGLFVVLLGLIGYHMANGEKRWLDPVIGLISLVIVFLGVAVAN